MRCKYDCLWEQRYHDLKLFGDQGWSAIRWMSMAVLSISLFQSHIVLNIQWDKGIAIEINKPIFSSKGLPPCQLTQKCHPSKPTT